MCVLLCLLFFLCLEINKANQVPALPASNFMWNQFQWSKTEEDALIAPDHLLWRCHQPCFSFLVMREAVGSSTQALCPEPQWPCSKHSYFLHVVRDELLVLYMFYFLNQELICMKCLHNSVCVCSYLLNCVPFPSLFWTFPHFNPLWVRVSMNWYLKNPTWHCHLGIQSFIIPREEDTHQDWLHRALFSYFNIWTWT